MKNALRLALVAVLALPASAQEAPEEVTVVRRWTGDVTKIEKRETVRILDADAWTKLWERHEGKGRKPPDVDFTRHMVVASFLGRVDFERLDVHAVRQSKDELVVGLELSPFGCCEYSARTLWCAVVLPKSSLKMSVVLRVKTDTGVDPRRDEMLAELPAVP